MKILELHLWIGSIIGCLILSCAAHKPQDSASDISDIKSVLYNQVLSWNNGDIEKYMEGYMQSDSLRFATGDEITYGWYSTLRRYQKRYPTPNDMGRLTFSIIDVNLISDHNAIVFGRWHLDAGAERKPQGLFTLVFKKTKTGWQIVHDHTSAARE